MTNDTKQALNSEIETRTLAMTSQGYRPAVHIACVGIEDHEDAGDIGGGRAQVICRDGVTVGVLVVPGNWDDPPNTGMRLVVPPDPDGWAVMDLLLEAGVDGIQFWAV